MNQIWSLQCPLVDLRLTVPVGGSITPFAWLTACPGRIVSFVEVKPPHAFS